MENERNKRIIKKTLKEKKRKHRMREIVCSCKWEMERKIGSWRKRFRKTDRKYKEKYIKTEKKQIKVFLETYMKRKGRERGYRGQTGRGGVRASREQRVFVNSKTDRFNAGNQY